MALAKEPYDDLSLVDFQKRFPDEAACWSEVVRIRWPKGRTCPKCHKPMGFVQTRRLFQCASCRQQISATAGTMFHKSHVPLPKWFWAMYWMAVSPKGVSMRNLQKHLGIGSYETVWLMGHKIRGAMMQRDTLYKFKRTVQAKGNPRFVTFEELESYFKETLLSKIDKAIEKGNTLKSDDNASYTSTKASTYHGCFPKYRNAYLAEFSYRFNCRYWPGEAFQRLLFACVLRKPKTLKDIKMS